MNDITRTPVDAAEAVTEYLAKNYNRKILVSRFGTYECIRWGKIVHIKDIRRVPKIHKDGTVTVRDFGEDRPIKAQRIDFVGNNGKAHSWFSFDIA